MAQEIDNILSKADNTSFGEDDWNVVFDECSPLASKWQQLSAFLGLKPSIIDRIKSDFPNDSLGCWSEALKEWIRRNYDTRRFGEPSWKTLLKSIAKVDKLHFERLATEHQASTKVHQASERIMPSPTVTESNGAALNIPELATVGSDFNMPTLTLEQKSRVCSESQRIMYKFQELFTATRKSLCKEKVSIKDLVHHLECLGSIKPAYKDVGQSPLRCQLPALANAKSVDDVMSVVKDYSPFFNYRMLEHIISEFGTEKDKQNLAEYKEDFIKYAECCVIECPSEVCTMSKDGHNSDIIVTLDDSFDNCTVSHLNIFIDKLRTALNISSHVHLKLCRICRGSVILIFQLPVFEQQAVFPLSEQQEKALADLGIVELSCGTYHFNRKENKEIRKARPTDVEDSNSADSVTETELHDLEMEIEMGHGVADASNENELFQAIERGDLKKVKELVPLQKAGKFRATILHYTAWFGQLEVLRYFIEERGCNPASQDSRAMTPLHYAALTKHLDIVRYLVVNQQMNPLCCDDDGTTPLHAASQAGDINTVRYLVNELSKSFPLQDIVTSRGIDGAAPIHLAALYGHLEVVEYFITGLNCDPNIASPVEYQDMTTGLGGRIALHDAAQGGHLPIVKYLVEQCNCNPSYFDNEGVTPLHMAAQYGHLEVAQYLTLEQHCDPLCADIINDTPLHYTIRYGQLEVLKFFIEELHCPPDICGHHNATPLELAHRHGYQDIVSYLKSIPTHPKLY